MWRQLCILGALALLAPANALGGKRVLVAGKGSAYAVIATKAARRGFSVSVLVEKPEDGPKIVPEDVAGKIELLPLNAFGVDLLERIDSLVVAPDAPATKGLMKSVLADVSKMQDPKRLKLILTSFLGVERAEKMFSPEWRANFVRGGDIVRAAFMERYVKEELQTLGCPTTFVRHGKLLGGGGEGGLGDIFYTGYYFPEYGELLKNRIHDNAQCDYEMSKGDALDIEETNRRALANACVAALDCPACEFGIISTEGLTEDGPWPDVDAFVKPIKDFA